MSIQKHKAQTRTERLIQSMDALTAALTIGSRLLPTRSVVEHKDGTVTFLDDVSFIDGPVRGQRSGDVFRSDA